MRQITFLWATVWGDVYFWGVHHNSSVEESLAL
jgi:hypothetical protein